MKKAILFIVILILFFISNQCTPSLSQDKAHYVDLFCSLEISFIDTLLLDVRYVSLRNSNYKGDRNTFIIDFEDSNRIVVIKDNYRFTYRELDSVNQGLSLIRPLPYDWKYLVSPERITIIINFCLEKAIHEISIRGNEKNKRYYFKTREGVFYYTEDNDYTHSAENICGNWYFM